MSIHYGRVSEEHEVDVKNHAKEAALVGGVAGAVTSGTIDSGSATGNVLAGSGIGAITGVGIEYLGEWRMKGVRYTIESAQEGVIHIITDQTGIQLGDCVAIEASGSHANIRRVSDVYCETIKDNHHLDAHVKQSAVDCYEAKKTLLGAETPEDMEQAKRRVRALCDT